MYCTAQTYQMDNTFVAQRNTKLVLRYRQLVFHPEYNVV